MKELDEAMLKEIDAMLKADKLHSANWPNTKTRRTRQTRTMTRKTRDKNTYKHLLSTFRVDDD